MPRYLIVADQTAGSPELVTRARSTGAHVMHRCNLTAILLPNYADIPELLARHEVEIIASLPYYQSRETDAQRGEGVFEESLCALRLLNALGYGRGGSLKLNLVMNPVGTFLPGSQPQLEMLWKRELKRLYDVVFDQLYTITNMPISRFLEFLEQRGRTEEYLNTLVNAFNPAAARGVMCRNTLSVGWDGTLYDCDFNQMLELPVTDGAPVRKRPAASEPYDTFTWELQEGDTPDDPWGLQKKKDAASTQSRKQQEGGNPYDTGVFNASWTGRFDRR